jgi:hypothetical protein
MNKNERGYTIVELLVALNIAMIVISVSAALYYGYNTYRGRIYNIIEKQQYTMRSLEYIHSVLDKSEKYTIRYVDQVFTIIPADCGEIIIDGNSINRNDVVMINELSEVSVIIADRNNQRYHLDLDVSGKLDSRQIEINSVNILSITISIKEGSKKYIVNHHPRNIANRRFKNITG